MSGVGLPVAVGGRDRIGRLTYLAVQRRGRAVKEGRRHGASLKCVGTDHACVVRSKWITVAAPAPWSSPVQPREKSAGAHAWQA